MLHSVRVGTVLSVVAMVMEGCLPGRTFSTPDDASVDPGAPCPACAPQCGNGTCDSGEDCYNCSADCGGCTKPDNALDLADMCNGEDDQDDDTCIRNWLEQGQRQGKELYVSRGTYMLGGTPDLFNGARVSCASADTVVFKKMTGQWQTVFYLVGSDVHDVTVQGCGFDMNGDPTNFAAAIVMAGSGNPARNLTVRYNRIFDSTQRGSMFTADDRQRQYIVLIHTDGVLVEGNRLSEGGRIKAGRPGRNMVIRGNRLENINDNGITVVDDQSGVSESQEITIEENVVIQALTTGIFFGADGKTHGTPEMATRRITVRNNQVSGDMTTCILGMLPNLSEDILVEGNTCHKTGTRGDYPIGIAIGRANESTQPARNITVRNNTVGSTSFDALSAGAIYLSGSAENLCVIGNRVTHSKTAAKIRNNVELTLQGNDWGGGDLRTDDPTVTVRDSGDVSGCLGVMP